MKRFLAASAFALVSLNASATVSYVLSEDFDVFLSSGWTVVNNSTAGGTTSWFAGNQAIFPAQAGAPNAYAAANFNSAGFGGNISDWLLSPVITIADGEVVTFYTRTETDAFPGDNLELRFSTAGASTDVGTTTSSLGNFGNLLLSVASASYPQGWTQYTATISGVGAATTGRIAFRYLVTDTSNAGDYVGVDTVRVSERTATVPEPATLALVGLSLAAAGLARRRQARA